MVINNGLIVQWGRYAGGNNRLFTYPITLSKLFAISLADITPVTFDNYTCTTYLWSDTNVTAAHVITTNQHTPSGYIIVIGI